MALARSVSFTQEYKALQWEDDQVWGDNHTVVRSTWQLWNELTPIPKEVPYVTPS